jgi:flagellar motor switch protein FliN/FliY
LKNTAFGKDKTVAEEKNDSNLEPSDQVSSTTEEPEKPTGEPDVQTDGAPANASEEPSDQDGNEGSKDLEFILDIPLEISVELGRTEMVVNELLRLGQGSIVELSKLSDEPMDIYVNRKLFARGEVVVVNEKFGIRLTDIVSPAERVESLG